MKSSFILWGQLCPGSAAVWRSALRIPAASPQHPCSIPALQSRGCSGEAVPHVAVGSFQWGRLCVEWGAAGDMAVPPPPQADGLACVLQECAVYPAQPPLSPDQLGNWKREDIPWYVAPRSGLIAKLLRLIAGLCFSLVYQYSNLSFVVTVF